MVKAKIKNPTTNVCLFIVFIEQYLNTPDARLINLITNTTTAPNNEARLLVNTIKKNNKDTTRYLRFLFFITIKDIMKPEKRAIAALLTFINNPKEL
jgi:hypothetical protein